MKKPIHIIHLLPSLDIGGMENGVVNLVNTIDLTQFSTSICCLNFAGAMADRISPGRARIVTLGQKSGRSYTLPLKMMALFSRLKADIIHTHNYYSGIYGIPAAKMLRIPVVHGEHGFDCSHESGEIDNKKKEKLLCRLADHILCVSPSLKDVICNNFKIKSEKVSVITNGVDFEKYASCTDTKNVRKKLGIDDDKIVIGSVGRLNHIKNYTLLINAVALLSAKERVAVLLVGDGPERERLHASAKDSGIADNLIITGARTDIPDMLSVMDFFVLPSLLEGMSNSILEAMCAGLPVVASNVGGNPEL